MPPHLEVVDRPLLRLEHLAARKRRLGHIVDHAASVALLILVDHWGEVLARRLAVVGRFRSVGVFEKVVEHLNCPLELANLLLYP